MRPVSKLTKIKTNFVYTIIIASLASGVISMISECPLTGLESKNLCLLITLLCFIFISYCYLYHSERRVEISANSLFLFSNNGDVIRIPDYLINQKICNRLQGALVNNKEKNKYTYGILVDNENRGKKDDEYDTSSFLKDAIECDFLNWLSCIHLGCRNKEYINRFIQRDVLSSQSIVLSDLKIDRDKINNLVLKNSYYTINLSADCSLTEDSLPSEYSELILNRKGEELIVYNVHVTLSIIFNVQKFAFSYNSSKIKWIDDMVEKFEEHNSFDKYLDKIGYYKIKTIVHALKVQK